MPKRLEMGVRIAVEEMSLVKKTEMREQGVVRFPKPIGSGRTSPCSNQTSIWPIIKMYINSKFTLFSASQYRDVYFSKIKLFKWKRCVLFFSKFQIAKHFFKENFFIGNWNNFCFMIVNYSLYDQSLLYFMELFFHVTPIFFNWRDDFSCVILLLRTI